MEVFVDGTLFPSLLQNVEAANYAREMLLKEKMKEIDEHIECQRVFEKWWNEGGNLSDMKEFIEEYKIYKKEWYKEWFKEIKDEND